MIKGRVTSRSLDVHPKYVDPQMEEECVGPGTHNLSMLVQEWLTPVI